MGDFGRNIFAYGFEDSVRGEEAVPNDFTIEAKQLKNQDSSSVLVSK